MFWVLVLLFSLGMLLILLEVAVPHGLSALAGAVVIAFSGYLCFKMYGFHRGLIYVLVAAPLAAATAFFVLRSSLHWLMLRPPSAEPPQEALPEEARELPPIGAWLEVTQPLRPTGTVSWRGRRFPARSLQPEAELGVGAPVRLRELDSIYLLVEPAENEK